ncbi:MAG: Maf family protein [Paracoccaceae bacterium]|nr:Putative Maf-like protein [Rhodobacterales bacterium HTCC2150] [Rhodobacteraceae bacterium HTCC2150]MDG1531514.1 Maf family protein [Paracoccaceae bacterium]
MRLVLGSGSPRRLELLAQIGVVPDEIRAPDIDETPKPAEKPREYCNRIAQQKLAAIPASVDELVLCADTTVALGRRIMGKPVDAGQAAEFLLKLSGRRHRVVTAIAMKLGEQTWTRDVVSTVQMKRLSDVELNGYLATDDWRGKAGGYAIQGPAATLIPFISGSFSAVVGLPLAETASLLRAAGYPFMRAT